MTVLDDILRVKQEEVRKARARTTMSAVEAAARALGPVRGLRAALSRPPGERVRFLTEIKRASPSAGPIRADADPAMIAREYEAAGAAAISVLTDRQFFSGELGFLMQCRAAVAVPLLRKDFIIDPYQVAEARAAGADGVLLIVAALSDAALAELWAAARSYDLDVLVEVHDQREAERALALPADLIGVNHRDLRTFAIDRTLTRSLAPLVLPHAVLVAESGIRTAADVEEVASAGAHAVLVGETLMRAASPGTALRELRGELAR